MTQDKSVKLKSSLRPSREKSKTDKSPTAAKTLKRKSDVDGKNGKVGERSGRTGKEITAKIKRDSKTNIIYLKDVLENKVTKKEEKKDDEKKIRSKKVGERKESEETKKREESSKDKRDRRRTRTLSPTEIKQLIPEKITSQELEGKPVKPVVPKAEESEEFKEEEGGEADEEYEDDFEVKINIHN